MSHISKVRRDPRGRGLRGIFLPELPRYKTRSEKFDDVVLVVYEDILANFADELSSLDLAVDIVPRMRLQPGYSQWPEDVVADVRIPLGRLVPAGIDAQGAPTRPRLIIFRRPVELRTHSVTELEDLLRFILTKLVAHYLNVSPLRIDPHFQAE